MEEMEFELAEPGYNALKVLEEENFGCSESENPRQKKQSSSQNVSWTITSEDAREKENNL